MLVNIGGAALDLADVRAISGEGVVTFKAGSEMQLKPSAGETVGEAVSRLLAYIPTVKQMMAQRGADSWEDVIAEAVAEMESQTEPAQPKHWVWSNNVSEPVRLLCRAILNAFPTAENCRIKPRSDGLPCVQFLWQGIVWEVYKEKYFYTTALLSGENQENEALMSTAIRCSWNQLLPKHRDSVRYQQ